MINILPLLGVLNPLRGCGDNLDIDFIMKMSTTIYHWCNDVNSLERVFLEALNNWDPHRLGWHLEVARIHQLTTLNVQKAMVSWIEVSLHAIHGKVVNIVCRHLCICLQFSTLPSLFCVLWHWIEPPTRCWSKQHHALTCVKGPH